MILFVVLFCVILAIATILLPLKIWSMADDIETIKKCLQDVAKYTEGVYNNTLPIEEEENE